MKNRVVITGLGTVSPIGNTVPEMWGNAVAGTNGVGLMTKIDNSEMPVKVAAELKDFDISKYLEKRDARKMAKFTHYAIAAAQEAVDDAGLAMDKEDASRVGVWVGSGIGGMDVMEDNIRTFMEKGYRRVSPFFIPMMIPDMAAGQISIRFGAKGPNGCTVTACATGTNCIGEAMKFIQRGDADVMIAGGTEAPITNMGVSGFIANKALTTNPDPETACRPFDTNRDGFVIGEGAGILILESLEHAQARGAKIYAEVVGYGSSGDAHHITAPAPEGAGAQQAMTDAIKDADLALEEIGYINAHGTSTPLNDKFETMAIKGVFKEHAKNGLLVSSTKSMTGHTLGASGGIEAILTTLAIYNGEVPPTIHLEEADEDCDLDYVANKSRKKELTAALSNSFGFGGHNAVLAFKKYTN